MAELFLDPVLAAIGIAILGIVLWVVTNLNTIRVGKKIKTDIDEKRAETETFVDDRLKKIKASMDDRMEKLEGLLGGFERRMTAQIPPNVDGRIDQVRSELGEQIAALKTEALTKVDGLGEYVQEQMAYFAEAFEKLPDRMKMILLGVRGKEIKENGEVMDGVTETLVREGMQDMDPRVQRLMRFTLPKGYEERNPAGALLLEELRGYLIERHSGKGSETRGRARSGSGGQEM